MEERRMVHKQSRSDGVGIDRPARPDEIISIDFEELTRYDLVLSAIPLALLSAWVLGQTATVPMWAAMAAAALVALPMIADVLVFNPPT